MIRTGSQYLDSIRDGREIYTNGELVKAVTRHPMLKPTIDIRGLPQFRLAGTAEVRAQGGRSVLSR